MSDDQPIAATSGGLGPHLTVEDGQAVADAIIALHRVSKGRVLGLVIPSAWTDDQAKRLTRAVNRVLEAGEAGLRTIEDVLHG